MGQARSPVDITAILAALSQGDQAAIVQFTRCRCHLPAAWWPFVAETVWTLQTRLAELDDPVPYVRKVATRLRARVEVSSFGRQVVVDTHRRVIGHVTVGSFYRRSDGALVEEIVSIGSCERPAAPAFVPVDTVPTPKEKRVEQPPVLWVDTEDADERALQELQMRGVSRRLVGTRLGWDDAQVERVWKRLYRRRTGAANGKCPQTPAGMK